MGRSQELIALLRELLPSTLQHGGAEEISNSALCELVLSVPLTVVIGLILASAFLAIVVYAQETRARQSGRDLGLTVRLLAIHRTDRGVLARTRRRYARLS